MSQRLKLEVFAPDRPAPDPGTPQATGPTEMEEARLAAFENGYKDGWDDAVAAQADDTAALRAEVARNLQALAFTQAEARAVVLRDIAPLIAALVGRVLPVIATHALPQMIVEAMAPFADLAVESPLDLRVHPDTRLAVEGMLPEGAAGFAFRLIEDGALPRGAAILRQGEAETRLDVTATVAHLATLVENYFTENGKDLTHG